jgi:hypothetical protein
MEVGAHREEDLLRLLDGALVLSPVRLRGGRPGAREPLDRGLELVQRPLLPALPRLGLGTAAPVGLLLERAAPQEGRAAGGGGGGQLGRRAAEACVDGEVDDRGGGGHGEADKDSAISRPPRWAPPAHSLRALLTFSRARVCVP